MQSVAGEIYDKVAVVSAENCRLKARMKRIWVQAIAGQADASDNGAVAWRDALRLIEELAK